MYHYLTPRSKVTKIADSASDCRATSNDFRDLNMQLFVTYIVLFVTAVKARFSDFLFFHCGPYLCRTEKTWSHGPLNRADRKL